MRRHVTIRLHFPRDLDLIQLYLYDTAKFKMDMANAIKAFLHRQDFKIYPPTNFKAYQVTKKSYQIHLLFDTEEKEDLLVLDFLKNSIMRNRINDTLKILYREYLAYAFIEPYISWNVNAAEIPPIPKRTRSPSKERKSEKKDPRPISKKRPAKEVLIEDKAKQYPKETINQNPKPYNKAEDVAQNTPQTIKAPETKQINADSMDVFMEMFDNL